MYYIAAVLHIIVQYSRTEDIHHPPPKKNPQQHQIRIVFLQSIHGEWLIFTIFALIMAYPLLNNSPFPYSYLNQSVRNLNILLYELVFSK